MGLINLVTGDNKIYYDAKYMLFGNIGMPGWIPENLDEVVDKCTYPWDKLPLR